jgi:hypothetical protein
MRSELGIYEGLDHQLSLVFFDVGVPAMIVENGKRRRAPARLAQGVAPILFGALIDRFGAGALMVSAAMSLGALACLLLVHVVPSGD